MSGAGAGGAAGGISGGGAGLDQWSALGDAIHKNVQGDIAWYQRGLERKEGARQFDLQHGLSREQWDFQHKLLKEQEERKRRIRNALLGIGRTKTK